jgi:hypothetical protein
MAVPERFKCCSVALHKSVPIRYRSRALQRFGEPFCGRYSTIVQSSKQKTAARGSPLAAIGINYNRICSLPETCAVKNPFISRIRIAELVEQPVPRRQAEVAVDEAPGG